MLGVPSPPVFGPSRRREADEWWPLVGGGGVCVGGWGGGGVTIFAPSSLLIQMNGIRCATPVSPSDSRRRSSTSILLAPVGLLTIFCIKLRHAWYLAPQSWRRITALFAIPPRWWGYKVTWVQPRASLRRDNTPGTGLSRHQLLNILTSSLLIYWVHIRFGFCYTGHTGCYKWECTS